MGSLWQEAVDSAVQSWTVEAGRVELMVGPWSADTDPKLRQTITVTP